MTVLQIVVAAGCFGCAEALRIFQEVREQLPAVRSELIDISLEPGKKPPDVVAVPSYLIDGKVAFAGNPPFDELRARLEPGPAQGVIMYSTRWCPDCRRAKAFLDRHSVPYTVVDIDQDLEAARYVVRVNGGMRRVPTIVFSDGSALVEPSNAELARKLGIPGEPKKKENPWD